MEKQRKIILFKFIKFVKDTLKINTEFKVKLSSNHDGFTTTAYYNNDEKLVAVYTKGRAIVDILRSVAHEMVHMKQHEDGKIKGPIKDVGGPEENEANARAGSLIKQFGYNLKKEKIDIYSL